MIDVPPKLSAQVRVFASGNGRKTDPVDAHSVAMAAFHNHGLLHVEVDDDCDAAHHRVEVLLDARRLPEHAATIVGIVE